jgi:3-oxoacyl-[acyl-carrier-protein] synthase-3
VTQIRSIIRGTGGYLPERVLTNDDMAKIVETDDQWIQDRTGIKQRHIAADDQLTSDLAVEAAKVALSHAGIEAANVDLIVLATTTPDKTFTATATAVQAKR